MKKETAAEDVNYAFCNEADFKKRTTSFEKFSSDLTDCTLKANFHKYMKDIQRE